MAKKKRFSKHDEDVGRLVKRLEDKGKYDAVLKEVPFYDMHTGQKLGQMDVLTMRGNQMIYWELKTGYDKNSILTAQRQARAFYFRSGQGEWKRHSHMFVYKNTRTGTQFRIKKEQL